MEIKRRKDEKVAARLTDEDDDENEINSTESIVDG